MKPKIKTAFNIALPVLLLLVANYAQADLVKCGGPSDPNGCTIPDLLKTIVAIINFLLSWAWLLSTLLIVWGGWGMLTSGGNAENVEGAKTTFKQAVIGFFLIMASFVLINFILSLVFGSGQPRAGTFDALFGQFNLKP